MLDILARGFSTRLEVYEGGWLARVITADGRSYRMSYAPAGLMTRCVGADGNNTSFRYEAGRLREEWGRRGLVSLSRTESATGVEVRVATELGPGTRLAVARPPDRGRVKLGVAGARSEVRTQADGTRTESLPDGTRTTYTFLPDPRFGAQVPVLQSIRMTTPGGRALSVDVKHQISVEGRRVKSQEDVIVVNGRSHALSLDATRRTATYRSPEGRTTWLVFDE